MGGNSSRGEHLAMLGDTQHRPGVPTKAVAVAKASKDRARLGVAAIGRL